MFRIPHDALVFVGDGQKALFLRNVGDALSPSFKTEKVFEDKNPSTREQGSDRPGRVSEAALPGRRSAVEQTDWHEMEERCFAQKVASAMEKMVRASENSVLVVVAPPRTLADLRNAFHDDVKARLVAEINKDLTKMPVDKIGKYLLDNA